MSTLDKRLMALEAAKQKNDTAQATKFGAALSALFDGVGKRGAYDPDKMAELLERLDTATATEAERAMLDNLPPCGRTPHELVRMVVQLEREV